MSLLALDKVTVSFDKGKKIAIKDVSLSLEKGETLGIVGESGSGKSTLARVVCHLQAVDSGSVYWKGQDSHTFDAETNQAYRRAVQLVFQDPLDALNPRMTVGQIIAEPARHLLSLSKREIQHRSLELLQQTGLSAEHLNRYPHEFSGGQCQRIGIARAMMTEPQLLVCDEPVSALDVSVQAQIINLLQELKQQQGMSQLFISHDMSVVRHICDRLVVLYQGQIVEAGTVDAIFQQPQHPYTRKLLASVPLLEPLAEKQRILDWQG